MKFRVLILLLFVCRISVAAPPERSTGIAAIANEAIITIHDVEALARGAIRGLERLPQYRANSELLDREYFKAKSDALEQLIERQLILDDFKSSGLVFPESYIDERINDIIRRDFGDRASMARTLRAEGVTIETFRQRQRDTLILQAMEGRNVQNALVVSPAKIERHYQSNLAKYKLDDQVKLRGIALNRGAISSCEEVRQLAQEIHTKILKDGASFEQMAAIYNPDPSQRRDGGDWGWHETSKLSKGFADIAAGLDAGKSSGVFSKARDGDGGYWIYFYDADGRITRGRQYSTKDGKETFVEEKQFQNMVNHDGLPVQPQEFFLLKVDEKKIAHTRPLNELRDEIEKELLIQERARLRSKWVERLKAKSFVRRF